MRASTAPMLKRSSRIAANVEKNRRGFDLQCAAGQDERRQRKRRRHERGQRQRHRALVADPAPQALEVAARDEPVEADLARLVADPEGRRRASDGSGGRQDRIDPEETLVPGREIDDERVNAERHEEHQRGVERADDEGAPPRQKDPEELAPTSRSRRTAPGPG